MTHTEPINVLTPTAEAIASAERELAQALAWCKKATRLARKLMPCDPAIASYWQGKEWLVLGEIVAARQALQTALLQQILYPARQEAQHTLTCGGEREALYANRAGSESESHNCHPGSGKSVASKAQDDAV